ncbi:MAG: twitching motility protein PilT [Acidobacteria bacterium SCN 69-37]|nr:MAG: twitching motility protein PilT [Acidobacteria bacterium SCN 69-37]
MHVAVDTNVLVYAEGVNDAARRDVAVALLQMLPPESTLLPVQVLAELFVVLVRKAGRSRAEASTAVLGWGDAFPLIESSGDVLLAATDLVRSHQMSMWDAVVLSAAADARCRLLLSEDLQDGFTWRGVTVTNPFAADRHPLLDALVGPLDPPAAARPVRAVARPGRPGPRARR